MGHESLGTALGSIVVVTIVIGALITIGFLDWAWAVRRKRDNKMGGNDERDSTLN